MNYVVYDSNTGEVLRYGTCSAADLAGQASGANERVVESDAKWSSHWVNNGVVQAYTDPQVALKAARPNYTSRWDNQQMQWVDSRSLDDIKRQHWVDIKAQAALDDAANITVGGIDFEVSEPVRAALFRKAQVANMNQVDGQSVGNVNWRKADDDPLTLTPSQMKALVRAIDDRSDGIRDKLTTLRASINAANTSAEVAAVTWSWP